MNVRSNRAHGYARRASKRELRLPGVLGHHLQAPLGASAWRKLTVTTLVARRSCACWNVFLVPMHSQSVVTLYVSMSGIRVCVLSCCRSFSKDSLRSCCCSLDCLLLQLGLQLELQAASCKLQAASCKLQLHAAAGVSSGASCKLHSARCSCTCACMSGIRICVS